MIISNLFVYQDNLLKKALEVIDSQSIGICLLVEVGGKFLRTITDGDIRRLLMQGHKLEEPLSILELTTSIWAPQETPSHILLDILRKNDIQQIPILNEKQIPVDIILRKHLEDPILLSYPHLGTFETKYVQQAFETNWVAPLGPNVESFEKEVAAYVGSQAALAVSSGTAAIHLALEVLDIGVGDIVFCSDLTFVASVNPILYQGATPVLIDSDPDTWNMSPAALQRAFEKYHSQNKLPKAVIVVNLYGQSANLFPIKEICDAYQVPIIEDAAESLGAAYHERKSGVIGLLGVYSFNGNKIITTSGGGMLISNNKELIKKAQYLSTQAKDPADYYLHTRKGYNYRMSNILAGVGRGQLKVLDERVQARRRIFHTYQAKLQDIECINWMPEPDGYYSTRWLSCCVINPNTAPISLRPFYRQITQKGIEVRRIWNPMHSQPLFANIDYFPHKKDESVSDYLFENGLCLPSSSNMTETQQNRVIETIRYFLGKKN